MANRDPERDAIERDRLRSARKELEAMIDAVLSCEERRVILVDGFNVLHATLQKAERDAGWWKREQRERLLQRVARWPTAEDEVWVAFDGTQPAWSCWAEPVARVVTQESQPLETRSEGAGDPTVHSVYVESADDWIVRRARRAPHPERTIVVTRDRQVAGRARGASAATRQAAMRGPMKGGISRWAFLFVSFRFCT